MIGAHQNTFICAAHFLFARDWDLMGKNQTLNKYKQQHFDHYVQFLPRVFVSSYAFQMKTDLGESTQKDF